jgi:hypothetical protein
MFPNHNTHKFVCISLDGKTHCGIHRCPLLCEHVTDSYCCRLLREKYSCTSVLEARNTTWPRNLISADIMNSCHFVYFTWYYLNDGQHNSKKKLFSHFHQVSTRTVWDTFPDLASGIHVRRSMERSRKAVAATVLYNPHTLHSYFS